MTLRRKLLLLSAPAAAVLVVVIIKAVSVMIAGDAVARHYADGDAAAMRSDIGILEVLNLIEPQKAVFATGAAAVLDGRLDEADRRFTDVLAETAGRDSCAVRVNLELVRETRGDRAVAAADSTGALDAYRRARTVVEQAPDRCFAGNDDPDAARRDIRNDALPRLTRKIDALVGVPPPLPPAPALPPPQAEVESGAPTTPPDTALRLDPANGDPLDALRRILRDAAAATG